MHTHTDAHCTKYPEQSAEHLRALDWLMSIYQLHVRLIMRVHGFSDIMQMCQVMPVK